MISKVLLDLDDVLNEFTIHAMRHVGCHMPGGWRDYNPKFGFNIIAATNDVLRHQERCRPYEPFSYNSFWSKITKDVWESVPKSKLFDDITSLASYLVGIDNIFVVTSPITDQDGVLSSNCIDGKLRWIDEHVPLSQHQLVITKSKWTLATPDNLLIDDSDKNVNEFRNYGGKAILFPRPWNSLNSFSYCPMEFVGKIVEALT